MSLLRAIGSLSTIPLVTFSSWATAADSASNQGSEWQLVWSDEFDRLDIDKSKWSHDIDCWGGGNEERQCYTDFRENSYIKDGKLVITARLEKVTGPALPPRLRHTEDDKKKTASKPFSSARLTTKHKGDWLYGKIEVRAKMPEGQGTWPAIWMLPTHDYYGNWAASGEIDIMEAINLGADCKSCDNKSENNIFGTLHYGGEWPRNKYKSGYAKLPHSDDGFHTYGIEWSEGEILWFLDGERYHRSTSKKWNTTSPNRKGRKHAPFDQSFHLILNLAIGGELPEKFNQGGISIENYPKEMHVDWVRVYHCKGDLETAKTCMTPR